MKILAGALGLLLLNACSSNKGADTKVDEKTITFNDFEGNSGWGTDPALLDKGRAHSGRYAIKVDKDHEFSLTFDMAFAQVSSTKFKRIHMEAWALLPSKNSVGILGIQVINPENNQGTYGEGLKLHETVKEYNTWVPVSKDFILPDNISPTQHLRMSLWRAGGSELVLIDDVHLRIAD